MWNFGNVQVKKNSIKFELRFDFGEHHYDLVLTAFEECKN
jgi:ribosome-associated toxin RatA of RatAB toxin-antitoxin module